MPQTPPTISSEPFHSLAAELRNSGFVAHSTRLQDVLDGVWTTSNELLGELGSVVIAIRKECRPLTSGQKKLIRECLKQVRKAWPGFGLFSFFPPWQQVIKIRDDCGYCLQWNLEHPEEKPRLSCGPCIVCHAPGHLKPHPRQPTSVCLCQQHWERLNSRAYHFELYHLIYVVIFGIAAIQAYPLIVRLLGN